MRHAATGMTQATVIVFERRPRWGPELQRQFVGDDIFVRSGRAVSDVPRLLAEFPGSVVVLDFDTAPSDCLQLLGRLVRRPRPVPVIVVGSERNAELEWAVRELGASAFAAGFVPPDHVARFCRRQWSVGQPPGNPERR